MPSCDSPSPLGCQGRRSTRRSSCSSLLSSAPCGAPCPLVRRVFFAHPHHRPLNRATLCPGFWPPLDPTLRRCDTLSLSLSQCLTLLIDLVLSFFFSSSSFFSPKEFTYHGDYIWSFPWTSVSRKTFIAFQRCFSTEGGRGAGKRRRRRKKKPF